MFTADNLDVSPGLTSRPLLSVAPAQRNQPQRHVSPGLTSRPLLSALGSDGLGGSEARVAGVNLPAFVERTWGWASPLWAPRVSPGLTSRPLLSAPHRLRAREPRAGVAGVNLPAFRSAGKRLHVGKWA